LSRPFEADAQTVHLFHLDDLASGRVQDAVPGGKTGTVKDALPTLGRFGGAMSCDASQGWVDIAGLPGMAQYNALTVECWVKFRGGAAGDIICRNSSYMLRISGTVAAYIGIDGSWRTVTGKMPVPVDRWTHLAMTYEQESKQVKIYIDGNLDVAEVPKGVTAGKLNDGADVLRLGTNTWSASGSILDGKLDEVRVSSVARQYKPLRPVVSAAAAQQNMDALNAALRPNAAATVEDKPVPENTNLLINPGFESGMYGWRVDNERNALLLWQIETNGAPQGRAFLREIQPGAGLLISHPFAIARGKTHTLSGMMRADTACQGQWKLRGARCEGDRGSVSGKSFKITTEWQRFSAKLEVPKTWSTGWAYLAVGTNEKVKLDLDALSVVAGEQTEFTQTEAQSIGVAAALPAHNTFMLNSGAKLAVDIVNAGDKERQLALEYALTDWRGKQAPRQRLELGSVPARQAATKTLPIPDGRAGWFQIDFTVREGDKIVSETSRQFNVIEPMKGVGDAADSPLGMNTHMEREPNEHLDCNLGILSQIGVKWIRGWWGWGMAEKREGQFDWTEYDRQYDAVHRAGMELLPILLRYYPAWEQAWAGKMDKIERPPYKVEQWASFVKTTAEHYRDRVQAWEIWNEPVFSMDAAKEYAPLLKASYESIKAAAPNAQVVGGGGVGPDYIHKFCEAGSAKSMDIVSHHSYSCLRHPFAQMARLSEDLKPTVAKFNCTSRVWHTEQGSGADGVGYRGMPETELDCAVNLVQSYLSALSLGVEKFFWFSAQTTATYGWAVYYENYVPRPRLVALNGLARLLKDRKITGRATLGDGKVACVILEGKAGPAVAVWNLDDTVTLRLPEGTDVAFTDMLCNAMEPPPGAKGLELRLGRPVYILTRNPATRLMEALQRAQVDARPPLEVTASRTPNGKLELSVSNECDHSLDLLVYVQSANLFAADPAPVAVLDLAPQEVKKIELQPDKRPAEGAETPVSVKIDIGAHGMRQSVHELKVRF
jgi:hypothetical protein